MSLSLRNINTGQSNKLIQPGNVIVKINSIIMEKSLFKNNPEDSDAYSIILNVEGKDQGEKFKGFFIDKDDPSKGTYKGSIGRIKTNKWPYKDGITKGGTEVSRDNEILKFIKTFCSQLDLMRWFESQDEQHEDVFSLMSKLNEDGKFRNKWLKMCIAGKEYTNKGGYTNYDLFLPKYESGKTSYELESVSEDKSRILTFDASKHIERKQTETVESFEEPEEPKTDETPKKKKNTSFQL